MWCTQNSYDIFTPEKKCGCNGKQKYLCFSIATCNIYFFKKCFEACDQTVINFISLTNENKNSEDDSEDDEDLQEPHDSDDDVTVDGYFF